NNGDLRLTDSAMEALINYRWPGNARQLRNEIERLFVNPGKSDLISPMDLSQDILSCFRPVIVPIKPVSAVSEKQASSSDLHKLRDVMRPLERDLILSALEKNLWNISHTAKDLGMSRRGLRLKIKRLGICKDVRRKAHESSENSN